MGTAKLTYDRWATLCALEVLTLIANQVEKHGNADAHDVESVLLFLREIGHSCLDNTEKRLLLPLLDIEIEMIERTRLGLTLEHCRRLPGLLTEVERCHHEGRSTDFVAGSNSYATTFGDLIFEEERLLRNLCGPLSTQDRVQRVLAEFDQAEAAIISQIQSKKSSLRRLEAKYVSPHCI